METAIITAESLRLQIAATEAQLKTLKEQLASIEKISSEIEETLVEVKNNGDSKWPLTPDEYKRYGRQMIVPKIGIQGQLGLKASKVLIIGAGGLGCPSATYLAGSGVGTLGIVDGDEVETSNLHRQFLHNTGTVGMMKVDSAISYLKTLNPNVNYIPHREHLTPQNAASIVADYDLVLDCTDHPTSRYLISDTSILLSKPLVSASALRTDGQLIILNSPPLPPGSSAGGPCYRCIFPKPPPADSVVSCGDGGILGPVVGVMGVLMALEAIKLITNGKLTAEEGSAPSANSMLLFSANGSPQFRSLKMRARSPKCLACSANTELSLDNLKDMDYAFFCGLTTPVNVLRPEERVEAREFEALKRKDHVLLDVREKIQFDICSLEGSINVPFSSFQGGKPIAMHRKLATWIPDTLPANSPIYVVCRLGNDSQVIARKLKESGFDKDGKREIKDIKGGLMAWREQVDPSWPEY